MEESMNKLASDLEKQELEQHTSGGAPSVQIYSQLLAVYLYQNDLCNARFLWQRIPESTKSGNPELGAIWAVGRCMWLRDYSGTYQALKNNWSENVQEIMTAVQDKVRARAAELIVHAYSSVSLDTVSEMTGLSEDMVIAACVEKGWTVDTTTRNVIPTQPKPEMTTGTSSEDQLYKLTEFVSFLEN